jgi:F0F1-type ATP synthase assembly protein I
VTSQDTGPDKRNASFLGQLSMAMELPFVMVGGILLGGGLGYLLDRWLHTAPALALLGGALGFGVALRDILRRLSRATKQTKPGNGRDDE